MLFTLISDQTLGRVLKRDGELINADVEGRDMLSRWAYVKSSDPDKMNTRDIVVHLSTNVFAGSDTTAIALRAIVYFLCRHPQACEKMVAELDAIDSKGQLSDPISYKEASTLLPYMGAIVKEAHAPAPVRWSADGAARSLWRPPYPRPPSPSWNNRRHQPMGSQTEMPPYSLTPKHSVQSAGSMLLTRNSSAWRTCGS